MEKCESCGMPLDDQSTSAQDAIYCVYCQDQNTGTLSGFEAVKEGSITAYVNNMGKTREEAEQMWEQSYRELARWKDMEKVVKD